MHHIRSAFMRTKLRVAYVNKLRKLFKIFKLLRLIHIFVPAFLMGL